VNVIEIVKPPTTPRLRVRRVDFDAEAFSREATAAQTWLYYATHGGSVANAYKYPAATEAVVAIASPDGRVAVWHDRARANKVTLCGAATAATNDQAAAMLWDDRRSKAREAAQAACRILHAGVFNDAPETRDVYLRELLAVPRSRRPDWPLIHKASTNVLAAASALYAIGNVLGANRLFTGKAVTGKP
jgi:hypothetical protein